MSSEKISAGACATDLTQLSLAEASQLLRAKQVSPLELTRACLERIARLDPRLNAFITILSESALAAARHAEDEIQRGHWRGALHGVPIGLKDLIDIAGVPTTCASATFKNRVAERDAEVVRRLKAAGAVLLGKLNLHECAYGGSTVISAYGPVRNPWAIEHSAGGSSAGSAAAVAAELCCGALGSDTGGSIRQPAAFCGIVGLKPTLGRISTRGVVPLSWSFDHVGPMTRTVADAALMLQVLAGYDPEDPVSLASPVPDYQSALGADTSALRIGIPRSHFYADLHPEVGAAMESALDALGTLTASRRDIDIPFSVDSTVLRAEAWVYHQPYVATSPELYQPDTLRRIRSGAAITMEEYVSARRQVEVLRQAMRDTFANVDVVITPTAPVPPFAISQLLGDPEGLRAREILTLQNTRPFNIVGLPTLSLSCGFTRAGLPIGLQITGAAGAEETVLGLAYAYERATAWHERRPELG